MTDSSARDRGTFTTIFPRRVGRELLSGLPTAMVSVATSISFIHVFGTWGFLWPLIQVAITAHLLSAVFRALQPSLPSFAFVPVAVAAPAATVYVSAAWIRFGETLEFGLPLNASWSSMWSDLRTALDLIGDVVTPVDFDSSFGTMAMIVIAFIAVTTDAFATRYGGRVEVFVPAAATLFIVAAVGTEGDRVPVAALWIAVALVSTFLIRRDHSHRNEASRGGRATNAPPGAFARSTAGALLFAGFVSVLAAVVAPTLPGAGDEAWLTQRSRGTERELEPLVDIRRQLTDPSSAVLFTVRADASAYWRLGSLPEFDGSRWTVSQRLLDSASGELAPPIGASDPGVDTTQNLQRFTIENLAGNLSPVAASPTRLRASTQSLFYEQETGSLLVGRSGLRPGDSYEIQSTMISPLPGRLEEATANSPPDGGYLELPATDEVERLRAIVSGIVTEGTPAYRSALALQDYFRSNFTYSLDVSPIESSDATLEFLERRSGYCEHFASTFAVFARILGLPSRVAIGFTPGDFATNDSGVAVYTVRPMHAHAWPEVWFDELGWVLFEPTPGRGAPNSEYTNVPEEQAVEPPSPTTTVPLSPTTTVPSNLVPPSTTAVNGTSADSLDVPDRGSITWPWILLASVLAAIAAWTIALPRVCRLVVERQSDAEILRLWRRAVALYELERGSFPPSLSPREVAVLATSRLYDDDPFIVELAELTSVVLFDDPELASLSNSDLLPRAEAYLCARRERLSLPKRLRARLDPITVWRLEGGRTRP